MCEIGGRDHDRIEIVASKKITMIVIGVSRSTRARDAPFERGIDRIARRHYLCVGDLDEVEDVLAAHHRRPDDAVPNRRPAMSRLNRHK